MLIFLYMNLSYGGLDFIYSNFYTFYVFLTHYSVFYSVNNGFILRKCIHENRVYCDFKEWENDFIIFCCHKQKQCRAKQDILLFLVVS